MISDYNLKAVVFDDREEEAKPLIDALYYERIPTIFINFKNDTRDDKKLQNIRLVFADLIIGDSFEGEKSLEAIRTSILDNIDMNNGPFILICWSKHSANSNTLEKRLLEGEPNLNFKTISLDKNTYFTKNYKTKIYELREGIIFNNIISDIVSQLKELDYLGVFLEWEKDAKNSVSKILNNFLSNIGDRNKITNDISATIKSTIGSQKDLSAKEKLDAFYRTLNQTLGDSIENNISKDNEHDSFLNSLELEVLDANLKAEINSKILFESVLNEDKTLKNGNIYSFEEFKSRFTKETIEEICGYKTYDFFYKNIFQYNSKFKLFEKDPNESNDEFQNRHELEIRNYSFPILMEFTPSCDIANPKNLEKSRLIFGFLIDSKYQCLKSKSDSFYITSFHFKIDNPNHELKQNYRLALFTRNIFAVNPLKIKEIVPIIRARKEVVTDLQHAIANHISRIGISSIDGFN
ncbi:hypothetical protein [Aliarcobacter butzleri]|uniref:hypothetical protein n=1 Tax=Aliarcobacter butzleri TaxID=28197 RepID=UPI0021B449E5|nr:hypothetical protein [Aliarcobacter butzleri]MCT7615077.1 hypothetical protein [Aliarcobacter butzleri]